MILIPTGMAALWCHPARMGYIERKHMPAENNLPSIGIIYETWLTIEQAAKIMKVSESAARHACITQKIRSKKMGSKRRGEWRIDPLAARQYIRRKPSP